MLRTFGLVIVLVLTELAPSFAIEKDFEDASAAEAHRTAQTALRFGLAGDTRYRDHLLNAAIRDDPDCKLAHWHLGHLHDGLQWRSIRHHELAATINPTWLAYTELRERSEAKVNRDLTLARWCMANDMRDIAAVHYTRLLSRPNLKSSLRREAINALRLRVSDGQLVSAEKWKQLENERKKTEFWGSKLNQWRDDLSSSNKKRRDIAFNHLQQLDDVTAISALERTFLPRSEKLARAAVVVISNMPNERASQALARIAITSPWATVRKSAIDDLTRRPLFEYVPVLLSALSAPVHTAFRIQTDPYGTVRHDHTTYQEGSSANLVTAGTSVAADTVIATGRRLAFHAIFSVGRDVGAEARALDRLLASIDQAKRIEKTIEARNRLGNQLNGRLYDVLTKVTDEDVERSPAAWWQWWSDHNELEASPKPTYGRFDYSVSVRKFVDRTVSCFPAGTSVWTETGRRAIETVKVGDRVLSQNPDTGELSYHPVFKTTVRELAPIVSIKVEGSEIQSTRGHPFWLNGHGWRMAKFLKAGDDVHSVNGELKVQEVSTAPAKSAYNLEVTRFGTYFVGEPGLLVHDNKYRSSTRAILPGLMPSSK